LDRSAGDEHGLHAVSNDAGRGPGGHTRNAARALGLTDCGVIAPGMRADLAIWNVAIRRNCPTASASRPCTAGSSEALHDPHSDPRHHDAGRTGSGLAHRRPVRLEASARAGVEASAAIIAAAARGDIPIYGVNTGFGKLASVRIAPEDTETLQRNLILSHCCGVGEAVEPATSA
jgi:hypothetical protein